MRTYQINFLLIMTVLTLVGCSNPFGGDSSSVDAGFGSGGSTAGLVSAVGIISGSTQHAVTASGAHVQISVGNVAAKTKLKTDKGNTVYLNVQGQLLSQ